jgi:hypothetical protein
MGVCAVRSFAKIARARRRLRPGSIFAVLWLALLLAIVGYAAVRGESALLDLDEIGLIADP